MMQKLLSLTRRPDAVICSDNVLCMGAMKAIKDSQLRIPEDIGVLSFDNFSRAPEPPVTTVDIDVFELGVSGQYTLQAYRQSCRQAAAKPDIHLCHNT